MKVLLVEDNPLFEAGADAVFDKLFDMDALVEYLLELNKRCR